MLLLIEVQSGNDKHIINIFWVPKLQGSQLNCSIQSRTKTLSVVTHRSRKSNASRNQGDNPNVYILNKVSHEGSSKAFRK